MGAGAAESLITPLGSITRLNVWCVSVFATAAGLAYGSAPLARDPRHVRGLVPPGHVTIAARGA